MWLAVQRLVQLRLGQLFLDTRRYINGWLVLLGKSHISWKTKKQHILSRSSADAEYRSMATTTCELKWLQRILSNLGVANDKPVTIHYDNLGNLTHCQKSHVPWTYQTHWSRLSFCSEKSSQKQYMSHLYLYCNSTRRYIYKGFGKNAVSVLLWQVGHSKSSCSNLREVLDSR